MPTYPGYIGNPSNAFGLGDSSPSYQGTAQKTILLPANYQAPVPLGSSTNQFPSNPYVIRRDTFTPLSPQTEIDIRFNAYNHGYANIGFAIAIGRPTVPGGPLWGRQVTLSPDAGVTEFQSFNLGQLSFEASAATTRIWRPPVPLQPGTMYTVEILGQIVGGSKGPLTVGTTPHRIAVSTDPAAPPFNTTAWITNNGNNTVTPITIGGRNFWSTYGTNPLMVLGTPQTPATTSIALPANANPEGIACSPISTGTQYVVVCNNGTAASVTFINQATSTVIATTAVTGGAKPYGVCIDPTNTTAYVSANDGRIYPFTLATQAIGAGVLVNALNDSVLGVGISSDGTKLFVCNSTTNRVYVLNVPALTLIGSVAVGLFPVSIGIDPNNNAWCACFSDGTIHQVLNNVTHGLTLQTFNETYNSANSATPGTFPGDPTFTGVGSNGAGTMVSGLLDLAVMKGGDFVFWINNRMLGYNWQSDGRLFDRPVLSAVGYGLAATPDEYLLMALNVANQVFQLPNATIMIRPQLGIVDEYAQVTIRPAV